MRAIYEYVFCRLRRIGSYDDRRRTEVASHLLTVIALINLASLIVSVEVLFGYRLVDLSANAAVKGLGACVVLVLMHYIMFERASRGDTVAQEFASRPPSPKLALFFYMYVCALPTLLVVALVAFR